MGYRWPGFRKVKNQVIKRMARRIDELGLEGPGEYEEFLQRHAEEIRVLEEMLRITISSFWRDRALWEALRHELLPGLAAEAESRGVDALWCLSAGCCSGEEPYTLRILWDIDVLPGLGHMLPLRIRAIDTSQEMLARAREALYTESSTRNLPPELRERAFMREGDMYRLRDEFRSGVEFLRHDVREPLADGPFDMVLCRNLVLTYFSREEQVETLKNLIRTLRPGGIMVTGIHESLPPGIEGMALLKDHKCVYQRTGE